MSRGSGPEHGTLGHGRGHRSGGRSDIQGGHSPAGGQEEEGRPGPAPHHRGQSEGPRHDWYVLSLSLSLSLFNFFLGLENIEEYINEGETEANRIDIHEYINHFSRKYLKYTS